MSQNILNKSWFMKYKPTSIDELIFENDEHKQRIENWIKNESIDGNILLYGPPGLGKTITAQILIQKIIKHRADLLIATERSTNEVREKIKPFTEKKPIKSKIKIVYIEEMDKMHPDALNILKNGLMEKIHTYFIGCTNFISRIASKDNAILSRFTYKISFSGSNLTGLYNRLSFILQQENANFNPEDLKKFLSSKVNVDIRDIINELQNSFITNNGTIDFTKMYNSSNIEMQILKLIGNMLNTMKKSNIQDQRLCYDLPENSPIANDYKTFVTLLHNNYDVNYDLIYHTLYNKLNYIPAKMICGKYEDNHEFKKHKHLNLLAMFYELMICISKMTVY